MHLWLLTEERPRAETIFTIVKKFAADRSLPCSHSDMHIVPLMEHGEFTFTYEVTGITCDSVDRIFVKTVSGESSFVDYLVFYSETEPTPADTPLYLIEETKTDDSESRNVGVYQRCSKFVYAGFFYPEVPKIMLYTLKVQQKEKPTDTYIFGTKMLRTLGVEIMGKVLDDALFAPFTSPEELMALKNAMASPPKDNVPVRLKKEGDTIFISARLENGKRLAHDPNIGMTTIMAACLRALGWTGSITITTHKLPTQQSVGTRNKFVQIAHKLGVGLEGFTVPARELPEQYWHYEQKKEKIGTIFVSILCEEYGGATAIYENHGGCERGYFIVENGAGRSYLQVEKYADRAAYKAGDKKSIIFIPDTVLLSQASAVVIEGKTTSNIDQGLAELENLDFFERNIIAEHYPHAPIERTLVLYGGTATAITDSKVGLLLTSSGDIILGPKAPLLFQDAVAALLAA